MRRNGFFLLVVSSLICALAGIHGYDGEVPQRALREQYRNPKSNHHSVSTIFPVLGNVYPIGHFYVSVKIGTPAKTYYLDIDTGSDVTWVQCDAPCQNCFKGPHPPYKPNQNNLVRCSDPLCSSIPKPKNYICENPNEQCDYEVEYHSGASSLGVMIRDSFNLRLSNVSSVSTSLAFGCGYDQLGFNKNGQKVSIDGVIALGGGKSSFTSQLRDKGLVQDVFGHCFSSSGGGYFFLGDSFIHSPGIMWVPMKKTAMGYYSPGHMSFSYGNKILGKNLPLVFDSGSTYTYFNSPAYQSLLFTIRKGLIDTPLREEQDDKTLDLCWKGAEPFKFIENKYFKTLTLTFTGNKKSQFQIHPKGYLIVSAKGNICLGILDGTEVGLGNLNVIGDISMHDQMIIFNNEKQQIGWGETYCAMSSNRIGDPSFFHQRHLDPSIENFGIFSTEDECLPG